jgi:hypothetical protein
MGLLGERRRLLDAVERVGDEEHVDRFREQRPELPRVPGDGPDVREVPVVGSGGQLLQQRLLEVDRVDRCRGDEFGGGEREVAAVTPEVGERPPRRDAELPEDLLGRSRAPATSPSRAVACSEIDSRSTCITRELNVDRPVRSPARHATDDPRPAVRAGVSSRASPGR